MSKLIYDITEDSIFSPRLISCIGTMIVFLLFGFLALQTREKKRKNNGEKNKYEKATKVGKIALISLLFLFNLAVASYEFEDVFNNYFVKQYHNGNYKTVSGNVKILNVSNKLEFAINDIEFVCISKDYNSRGYHTEDFYSNPFCENDNLKVYYVQQDGSQFGGYPDLVIVRIEKN